MRRRTKLTARNEVGQLRCASPLMLSGIIGTGTTGTTHAHPQFELHLIRHQRSLQHARRARCASIIHCEQCRAASAKPAIGGRRVMHSGRTTTILLVRHGHVPGIEPPRFRGRVDVELTEQGIRQARCLAQWIADRYRPVVVYTSPLRRCMETGRFIACASGVRVRDLACLNDLDYGSWQWKTHEEVAAESPTLLERWRNSPDLVRFPNGESLQDLLVRTADALRIVLDQHVGETVAMVSHDSFNRVFLAHVLGQPLSAYWKIAQAPCALNEISISDGRATVCRINQTVQLFDDAT